MNLVLDIGNTKIKWALFNQREIKESGFFKLLDFKIEISRILKVNYSIQSITIVTVVDLNSFQNLFLETINQKGIKVFFVNNDLNIPFKNNYISKSTLGLDRFCNIMAVSNEKTHCLVIDVGTCLKIDFLHLYKGYLGGSIAPGLPMRLKSMHHYTNKLPLLDYNGGVPAMFGLTTQESMFSGAFNGLKNEITAIVNQINFEYENSVKVFLTGGDALFFEKDIKNNIFVDKFLTLKGANEIFIYN